MIPAVLSQDDWNTGRWELQQQKGRFMNVEYDIRLKAQRIN
jgi:hypothetical protein